MNLCFQQVPGGDAALGPHFEYHWAGVIDPHLTVTTSNNTKHFWDQDFNLNSPTPALTWLLDCLSGKV